MKFIKILSLLVWIVSFGSFSQEELFEKGYIQIPQYMQDKISVKENQILFFFDFNCIYCKAVHPFMKTWGDSLPEDLEFSFEPIVVHDDKYKLNAAAWKYVDDSNITSEKKYKYMDHIYNHIHKITTIKELSRLIKESLVDVGLDVKTFVDDFLNNEYEDFLNSKIQLQKDINIEFTPTVLIGGKMLTHMGLNKGGTKEFITLLNAVTSFYIYQERNHDPKTN